MGTVDVIVTDWGSNGNDFGCTVHLKGLYSWNADYGATYWNAAGVAALVMAAAGAYQAKKRRTVALLASDLLGKDEPEDSYVEMAGQSNGGTV